MKKYSNISENLIRDIRLLLKNKYNTGDDIKLREFTPKILVELGIKDLPMLMNQTHIKENILSVTKAKKIGVFNKDANYHNLGIDLFIKVIDSLDNPLLIMKSRMNNNTYIIVTDIKNNIGEQIIVPIFLEGIGSYNRVRIKSNKVKSVYGKKNIIDFVDKTIRENIDNLIYITKDKKKKQIITSIGLQLSKSSNTAYINSITAKK